MSRNTWTLTTIVTALLFAVWFGAAAAGFPQPLRSAHSEPAKAMPPMRVVVTEEGKLYHRPDCTFIHGPSKLEQGVQAVADGYTPCTRCMKGGRN
jgi:hypothetical protein